MDLQRVWAMDGSRPKGGSWAAGHGPQDMALRSSAIGHGPQKGWPFSHFLTGRLLKHTSNPQQSNTKNTFINENTNFKPLQGSHCHSGSMTHLGALCSLEAAAGCPTAAPL